MIICLLLSKCDILSIMVTADQLHICMQYCRINYLYDVSQCVRSHNVQVVYCVFTVKSYYYRKTSQKEVKMTLLCIIYPSAERTHVMYGHFDMSSYHRFYCKMIVGEFCYYYTPRCENVFTSFKLCFMLWVRSWMRFYWVSVTIYNYCCYIVNSLVRYLRCI
jgi:hypothetical protein